MLNGGAGLAMVEVCWGDFESGRLAYQQAYIDRIRGELQVHRALGRRVTLALGLHCGMPSYVRDLGTFIGHNGTDSGTYDLVFSQRVRNEVQRILTKMDEVWGFENLWAVRVTSGANAEVLFPNGDEVWAYGNGAQNGADRPPSMSPNPMPGWRPGQTTWNGQQVSRAMLRKFADWYINGLVNVVLWQKDVLRGLGFTGYVEPVTPGAGIRPNSYDRLTTTDYGLNSWTFRVGAAWERFYSEVFAWSNDANIVVYNSSFAEGPLGPSHGDHCLGTDGALNRTQVESFSTTRFFNWLALAMNRRYHGENPGMGQPGTPYYSDTTSKGMMSESFRYIAECPTVRAFYWAHEHNLFDGSAPDRSVYFHRIRDMNGGATYIP